MTFHRRSIVTQNVYPVHENVAALLSIAFLQSGVLEECGCGLCEPLASTKMLDALQESLSKELEPLEKWLAETDRERVSTHTPMSRDQMRQDADSLSALVRMDATHPMLPIRWAHAHMWLELEIWGGIDQLDDNKQPVRPLVPTITPEIEQILTRILTYTSYWTGYVADVEPGWVHNLELQPLDATPPAMH